MRAGHLRLEGRCAILLLSHLVLEVPPSASGHPQRRQSRAGLIRDCREPPSRSEQLLPLPSERPAAIYHTVSPPCPADDQKHPLAKAPSSARPAPPLPREHRKRVADAMRRGRVEGGACETG